jgi:hypothetical protein
MPVTELSGGGLGSLVGMAAGYLAGNSQRKAAKAQQQFENQQKSDASRRADQELALNVRAATSAQEKTELENKQQQLLEGTLTDLSKRIPQPTSDPDKNPGEWQAYYAKIAGGLQAAGLLDAASKATAMGATFARAIQSGTQSQVNQATVPLRGAQTTQAQAQAKNIGTLHEDRQLSLADRLAIARTAAETSLTRAQIAASASDRRAADAMARSQNAIAAGLEREIMREGAEDRRQQATFGHQDASQARTFKHQDAMHTAALKDKATTPASMSSATEMSLMRNPKFKGLPAGVQTTLLGMAKKGATVDGLRAEVQKSPAMQAAPDVQQAVLDALGPAPGAPAPQQPAKPAEKPFIPSY